MVPDNWVPWEVTPGRVQTVKFKKYTSAAEVTLHEFSLTSAIVFSGDVQLWAQFQNYHKDKRVKAAQWAFDQAGEELLKVAKVQAELEQLGKGVKDSQPLLDKARAYLVSSDKQRRNHNYAEAYADAQRALRPLRVLMRAQWEAAVRAIDKDNAVASPYTLTYYTLPRHWQLVEQLRDIRPGTSALAGGEFEQAGQRVPPGWQVQEAPTLDAVTAAVQEAADEKREGNRCMMLEIKPRDGSVAPHALERTFLAVHSPEVRLPQGTWVRVRARVRIPAPIAASTDGALLYDSAGGEPLAIRLTGATDWKEFTFYRQVPPSGTVHVTLALTGLGKVYFDDVRVEPLGGHAPVEGVTIGAAQVNK
jgi:hypothetical protein